MNYYLKHFILFIIVNIIVFFLIYIGLNSYTRHNVRVQVPELRGVPLGAVERILTEKGLYYEVLDSTKFDSKYQPLMIIHQNPKQGTYVKKDRKIYLVVNSSDYPLVKVPDVIQITKRNAEALLLAAGFQIGKTYYANNIGKNVVLNIRYNGKKIRAGKLLPQNSEIDLVVGNGR